MECARKGYNEVDIEDEVLRYPPSPTQELETPWHLLDLLDLYLRKMKNKELDQLEPKTQSDTITAIVATYTNVSQSIHTKNSIDSNTHQGNIHARHYNDIHSRSIPLPRTSH